MGRPFIEYLDVGCIYACNKCKLHLTSRLELLSKSFWGATGEAFLFNSVINLTTGEPEERMMRTGLHMVRDLLCKGCGTVMGWKYDWASQPDQRYKEGKCILEKSLISKIDWN